MYTSTCAHIWVVQSKCFLAQELPLQSNTTVTETQRPGQTPSCTHSSVQSWCFVITLLYTQWGGWTCSGACCGFFKRNAMGAIPNSGRSWQVNELWGRRAGQCISKESGHCVPFPAGISVTHVTGPPRPIPPALNSPGHHITSLCRLKQSGVLTEDKYTTMSWYFSTWETFWNWSLTHEENSFLIGLNLRIEICGIHFRK